MTNTFVATIYLFMSLYIRVGGIRCTVWTKCATILGDNQQQVASSHNLSRTHYYSVFTSAREDKLQYHNDKFKTFRLIMGQCSPTMKQRIQATLEYKTWEDPEKCDVKSLLAFMEALVSGTEKGQYQPWVMQAQLKEASEDQADSGYESG
jgi:hypothetical protein